MTLAAMAGVMLWRENHWNLKVREGQGLVVEAVPATVPGASGPAAPPGSPARESELLSANGVLRKELLAAESRMGDMAEEIRKLKAAVEEAKPPPTPADLAEVFRQQRGLAFDPPPAWTPAPLETILYKIAERVSGQLSEESAQNRSRAAVAMGFHSEPFNYLDATISLAQMTNGGFYEPADNRFLYREEASLKRADGREAFIGGLAAALAREKGAAPGNLYDSPNDDQALAAQSLISGDANAARVRFSIADQLNLNFDRNGAPAAAPPNYSAPVYLAETWKFSQDKGSLFIEALTGQGGNAAIDAAYARPPRSSAEILHPELLYLADPPFVPLEVNLPETEVAGLRPYFINTAGELGTYIALRSWLGMDEATVASEGWAGDRYAVWPGEEGIGDHLFWKTVWRSEGDAREFFAQLRQVLMMRFSIPWRAPYDAVPGQFQVDDPRRVIRLTLHPESRTVTLLHATDPAFASALELVSAAW